MKGIGIQKSTLTVALMCKDTVDVFVKDVEANKIEDFVTIAKAVAREYGEDPNLNWSLGAPDQETMDYLCSFLSTKDDTEVVKVGGVE